MNRLALALALAGSLAGCGTDAPLLDGGRDAAPDAAAALDAGAPVLRADAGDDRYAVVGEVVTLDASASEGASSYEWLFGDGRGSGAASPDPVARVQYETPGRYRAFVTVRDDAGRQRTDSALIHVTLPLVHRPASSGTVAVHPTRDEVAVVSPDSNVLGIFSFAGGVLTTLEVRLVGAEPRTVTPFGERWAVVCRGSDEVWLIGAGETVRVPLPARSRPYGAVEIDGALLVSLSAVGELARIEAVGGSFAVTARLLAIEDARGVSRLPGGRVAVTRWRSPDDRAEIATLDPTDGGERALLTLAYDPQPGSDTESGGVPSYLEHLVVSPTGTLGVVPSLQAAIGEGTFVGPRPLTHETTLRAALSFVDLEADREAFGRRKLFDDRGLASAAVFSSHGDFAFVAMRGTRLVERLDVLGATQAGTIPGVGYAPSGLALSGDDRFLFVDAYLSRELVMFDVSDAGALPEERGRIHWVTPEPLSSEVLRGKRLFNDALDPRLTVDGYIACAHCHLDGESDQRVWDFTDRGEGLRNTIDLLGRGALPVGALHWSANFDEVQDFEHDIRAAFLGTGLMDEATFHTGTRDTPLGDPKVGLSDDLDALAAYVRSLSTFLESPFLSDDGSLPPAAARGRAVFDAAGCATCHAGEPMTDSGFDAPGTPRLHDVGTLSARSGMRLGGPLTGLDTPTLRGLWASPPYLHDGSAPGIREVLVDRNPADAHGPISGLSGDDVDDLIEYLRCL